MQDLYKNQQSAPAPQEAPNIRREMLTAYLATTSDECPSCLYALRGLKGDRCPECNQALTLRVALVEPRLASFLATMIALAAGFGFCALLVLYFLVMLMFRPMPGVYGAFFLVTGIGTLVNGAFMIGLIRKRGAFCRSRDGVRWSCFAGAVVLTLTVFALFTWLVR